MAVTPKGQKSTLNPVFHIRILLYKSGSSLKSWMLFFTQPKILNNTVGAIVLTTAELLLKKWLIGKNSTAVSCLKKPKWKEVPMLFCSSKIITLLGNYFLSTLIRIYIQNTDPDNRRI